MSRKDGGMQKLAQNRTLRKSVPQQNRKHEKTKNQLPRTNTQRRRRKRTGRDPTDNSNQQNITGQKRQLRYQNEKPRKVPKFHHSHRIYCHNYAKQSEIIQPKRNTTAKRKIPRCEQKRNQIPGENTGKPWIQRRNYKITDTYHTKRRHCTTTGCELVKTTTNHYHQNSIGRTHQPIKWHPHKISQTIRNKPPNQ